MSGWLITGAAGMLGTDLVARLRAHDHLVVALDRAGLDICDPAAVDAAIEHHRPATVVNCACWMAVDDAEADHARALAVNGSAVATLAAACARNGARLVQISTDYVFDGARTMPYGENDPVAPVNAYGRSKLVGERAALRHDGHVVRTAWLYGAHGSNFVRTMIRLAAQRDTVDVVDDQHGQPTWTRDLAEQIIKLIGSGAEPGIYHATNTGRTTWYHLAREVFTLLGTDPARVRPTTTGKFLRPAPRPAHSVLGHDRSTRSGVAPMRHWREALHAAWPL
jgi:dTDP-4-dehydrorhamnose reductase